LSKPSFLLSALAGVGGLWRKKAAGALQDDLNSADPERRGQALFRVGRTHMRSGEIEQAITFFDQALALLPNYAEAAAARAEALDMLGRLDVAHSDYQRARELWAAQRPGAPDRSYLFRQRGRFTFEVDSYELALLRVKTGSFPHLAWGNALLAQGRPAEAIVCYDRALKLKQNDPDLIALKGEALSMQGKYREAIKAFDTALAANPKAVEIINAHGIASAALGELDNANGDWHRQLKLLPTSQSAARACVALRLADYEAALPELEKAIAKEPEEAYWQLYRLTALRRLGKPMPAVKMPADGAWPAVLIDLQSGRATPDDARNRAQTRAEQAEALFQIGALAIASNPQAAKSCWREVVDEAPPSLIEYATAHNELSRMGS